ncbi:MAG: hypothetical protein A2901_09605 [Elusimicrobia bacterium RIFCSPLOWO2_01_FULL_54_10]|nr:MAG: hypothetical protein A2901_09605 [Elusimicrobia bacterium RIFCSPLOWO2_01_FULL_54_10]
MNQIISPILIFAIRAYQASFPVIRTAVGMNGACIYSPSCSHFAAQSIRDFGAVKGVQMALRRLSSCHG